MNLASLRAFVASRLDYNELAVEQTGTARTALVVTRFLFGSATAHSIAYGRYFFAGLAILAHLILIAIAGSFSFLGTILLLVVAYALRDIFFLPQFVRDEHDRISGRTTRT